MKNRSLFFNRICMTARTLVELREWYEENCENEFYIEYKLIYNNYIPSEDRLVGLVAGKDRVAIISFKSKTEAVAAKMMFPDKLYFNMQELMIEYDKNL